MHRRENGRSPLPQALAPGNGAQAIGAGRLARMGATPPQPRTAPAGACPLPDPATRAMDRIPEAELMDDPEQALAYAQADFAASDRTLVDTVLTALEEAGERPGAAVDLGCGPGNISFPLAAALAHSSVLAIDGAAAMLAIARQRQVSGGQACSRLHFHQARLPLVAADLDPLPPELRPPFPLLVSNSLLHHLGDPAVLWSSLKALGAPGALVVLRDLRRPVSPWQLEQLVERHGLDLPPLVRRDFALSLAAAFEPAEVESQLAAAGLKGLAVRERGELHLEVIGRLP